MYYFLIQLYEALADQLTDIVVNSVSACGVGFCLKLTTEHLRLSFRLVLGIWLVS